MGEQVAAGLYGGIAQLGEHLPCKQGVKGSNPFISTPFRKKWNVYLENCIQTQFVSIQSRADSKAKRGVMLA